MYRVTGCRTVDRLAVHGPVIFSNILLDISRKTLCTETFLLSTLRSSNAYLRTFAKNDLFQCL